MPVFLYMTGILLGIVGLFLIGFSIPIRDFSLGNTFMIAGATGVVGGLLLIGLGSVVRELRKVAKALEMSGATVRPVTAAPPARVPMPVTARPQPPWQTVVDTTRSQRAEPRLDALEPEAGPGEPPVSPTTTVADVAAGRARDGLFASIRGRSQATPQPLKSQAPRVKPPAADADRPSPPPLRKQPDLAASPPEPEANVEEDADASAPPKPSSSPRTPSLAALAARTAARLDLPRPVPDLPRATPERSSGEPPLFERVTPPEPAPPKAERNMFDTVWPTDGKPKPEEDDAEDTPPPAPKAEVRPPEILKSGVIDGMAYTLYTDGSIEAQLPQGTLRFDSIEDLRAHLERDD